MKPSIRCINLIKQFEGLYLQSYLCPASRTTIGYGTTRYEDGSKVELGQMISIQRAEQLLIFETDRIANKLPKMDLNQNQFDAVVSFCFNVGLGNFLKSTLYRTIKQNPDDDLCGMEFMKWTKARVNGELKVLKGLVRRRQAEKTLYYE